MSLKRKEYNTRSTIALRRLHALSTHPPPPTAKQVGPLGHLCVLSTKKLLFLSNQTNPDLAEGEGDSTTPPLPPPLAIGGGNKAALAPASKALAPGEPVLKHAGRELGMQGSHVLAWGQGRG